MIVYTGSTGSIGSDLPAGHTPLVTRLESPIGTMTSELRIKTDDGYQFIHLAALTSVAACENDPLLARSMNVDAAVRWYQAASETGCKRFIYVSTSHVFANQNTPLTVESPVGPRSVYGKSKLEAEEALKKASLASDTELVIARVFSILPRVLRPGYLLTNLHARAKSKDFSPIPGLHNIRDFIKTTEVGKQLVALTKEPLNNRQVVLICTGKGRSVREIALEVFSEHGLDGQILQEAPGRPDDVQYIVGTPYEFKKQ